jgi:uncharacterized protein (TIGR02145 family)
MRIKNLKYYVPLAALSGVLLFSCSHDELIKRGSAGSGAIGFTTVGKRFSTKVSPMVSADMRTFRVWGYSNSDSDFLPNLNGAEVSRASMGDDWVYSPMAEWPAEGTVDFVAVSPADATVDAVSTTDFSYTVPAAAGQVDLLVVKTSIADAAEHPSSVSLTFAHALSRIGLKVKTDSPGAVFKIEDVKLLNVSSQGTYSFDDGTWSGLNNLTDYAVPVDESWSDGKVLTTADSIVIGGDNGLMVLPQVTTVGEYQVDDTAPADGTYLSLKATLVQVSGDIEHTFYFPVVSNFEGRNPLEFEKGKQYTFNLELKAGSGFNTFSIVFSGVTAEIWQDGNGALITAKDYIEIAGVKWAKYNVDKPNTFAASETDYGMFYQFGKGTVGWSSEDPMERFPAGSNEWDDSNYEVYDEVWDMDDQNPCPDGWVVPTSDQFYTLYGKRVVWTDDYENSGIAGSIYSNESDERIFFPAPGYRNWTTGQISDQDLEVRYWVANRWPGDSTASYFIAEKIYGDQVLFLRGQYGHSVRCVKKE